MEICVKFPESFLKERSYVLNVLFSYFENVDLVLLPENRSDYELTWADTKLFIEDHFWRDISEHSIDQLWDKHPHSPEIFTVEELNISLVSVYGAAEFIEKGLSYHLKSDIIAASFFFLSRWEEWKSKQRDEHDRFPDSENYLIKYQLHQRPVVNDYIEFLRLLINKNTYHKLIYNRSYQAFVTHDVDEIFRYKPWFKWLKATGGDLVLRKDPVSALKTFFKGLLSQFSERYDDSLTFEYFMEVSEKHHLKSHFYFIAGEKGEKDFRYSISSKAVRDLILRICDRKHTVGIHPSYRSKEKSAYFKEEVSRLREISTENIEEGRHHYLRMNYPNTLKHWQNNGLKKDSSLGFLDHAGFRAGICYEFPVYDLDQREVLDVVERPLVVMEVSLNRNTNSYAEFKDQIQELSDCVRKYQGDFVLLWHNNNIHHPAWKKLGKHYEEIIKIIA